MRSAIFVATLAACGGDGNPAPATIELTRAAGLGSPSKLAFRDGDAAWAALPVDATEVVVASGRYELAVACEYVWDDTQDNLRYVWIAGRHVDDGGTFAIPCDSRDIRTPDPQPPDPPYHDVTLEMAEAGDIDIAGETWWDGSRSTSAPWSRTYQLPGGSYSIMARDGADHDSVTGFALRRDVAISGTITLPPISVAGEGHRLREQTFELNGRDPADSISSYSEVRFREHPDWYVFGDSATVRTLPTSFPLDAVSGRMVYLHTGGRYVYLIDYPLDAPTTFDLLPKLLGVTRAERTVTFEDLPACDDVTLSAGGSLNTLATSATPAWLGERRSLTHALPQLPDWDASWDAPPTDGLHFSAWVENDELTVFSETSVHLP